MNTEIKQINTTSAFARSVCMIVVCTLSCATYAAVADQQGTESSLRIYLPREITIEDFRFTLGQVGIVRGSESLVAKANKVSLGQISVPGQQIVLDRSLMFSRLACSGIPASSVTLFGAEKMTVKRYSKTIGGREFVELASAFLRKNPATASACQINQMRTPADLIIPDVNAELRLSPTLVGGIRNHARIRVAILADGKEIATRDVNFNLKYTCSKIVALVDIAKGQPITAQNVRIDKSVSDYPQAADWSAPYGLLARRKIAANATIHPTMVAPPAPSILIKRNDNVVVRIERPGLVVTATAKALQKGQVGDSIRVRNLDSNRVILVIINDDGTVKPVF